MKKLFVVAVLMVCAMIAYAQGASQALPVYVYRGNSILPTKTTIDLGNLAHPFDSVYAESGIFAIMFVDSLDVSMFLADGFDLGSGSFEEMWGTHFEADSAWIEYLGGGSPITLLDSLIGAYIQPDLLKAIDGLITQGSRAGAAVISNMDYPVALDDYTIIADTTVDLAFTLPPLSSAWDTASMTGLEFNFYNQGAGILSILQNEADTLSLGGQDSMHLAQYSGVKLQAISDSLWAVFAGGGGGGGTPEIPDSLGTVKVVADSMYWTDAFGSYLTLSDAVYFFSYPDSSYSYTPYSGSSVYEFPGLSNFYADVCVGSGFKLTQVTVYMKVGASRTFNFRVYGQPGVTGAALFDSTVTLGSAAYVQEVTWYPDSIEVFDDSIAIEIYDDWGQTFSLPYDSASVTRFYSADFAGDYSRYPDVDAWIFVDGVRTVPASVPVVVGTLGRVSGGFFDAGLSANNLYVDTLSVGVLQPANIVGDGAPFSTEGIPVLTDTCFTSAGDMMVFINGAITEFVSAP